MTKYTLTNIARGFCIGLIAVLATDSLVAMVVVAVALNTAFVATDEVRR